MSQSVEMSSTKLPGGLCATSWSVQLPPSSQGCCHSNGNLWSANDCTSWNHNLKLPLKNALMLKPYRRNKVGRYGQFFALRSNTMGWTVLWLTSMDTGVWGVAPWRWLVSARFVLAYIGAHCDAKHPISLIWFRWVKFWYFISSWQICECS